MRRRVYGAAAIIAVFALGACTHSSNGSAAGGGAGGGVAGGVDSAAQAAAAPAAGKPGANALNPRGSAATRYGGSAPAGQAAHVSPLDDGTYQIRIAQMTVAVKGAQNVSAKADTAETIAQGVGGEVDSDDRTSGRQASATLQLRVPPDALEDTLTKLSALGAEKSRQLSTTDVTQRMADVRSRVASAEQALVGLRNLYHRAQKVSDIITIETELNNREADLESLQAQYRALSHQTSMATITLSLVTAVKHAVAPVKKHAKKHGGFVGGLRHGWNGFVAAAGWVATAVGTLLPFLVLLLLVALGARLVWARLPHRHASIPTPTPAE
jgi:hypothetical protein